MYRKNTKGWLKHLDFLIWDLLLLELAFFIVYAYRIGVFFPFSPLYQRMVIAIVPAHLITVFFGNSYRDMCPFHCENGIVYNHQVVSFQKTQIRHKQFQL